MRWEATQDACMIRKCGKLKGQTLGAGAPFATPERAWRDEMKNREQAYPLC